MKIQEKDRKKWQEVLKMEYMSSEDSDGHENELKIRRLPWLSENVQKFKELLDSEKEKKMNAQSKRQAKKKITQGTSQRPKPSSGKPWMFKSETP